MDKKQEILDLLEGLKISIAKPEKACLRITKYIEKKLGWNGHPKHRDLTTAEKQLKEWEAAAGIIIAHTPPVG